MQNVLTIVRRDLLRILRVPAAWVIVAGLILLPPLYAWFNIVGFWNPYGNTRGIQVAVVNEDKGANTALLGDVNLGKEIVGQLKSNDELGWHFVHRNDAMNEVKSGSSYAAIVIPPNFSDNMAAIATGKIEHPKLDFYVNEKANAIATKVTDTGASTVDRQVNSTFVSTVSSVVSKAINKTSGNIQTQTTQATTATIKDLQTTQQAIADIRKTIHSLDTTLSGTPQLTATARQALATTQQLSTQASSGLATTSKALGSTQTGLNSFIGSSSTVLDQSSSLLSQASSKTNLTIANLAAGFTQANGKIKTALDTSQQVNKNTAQILAQLEAMHLPNTDGIIAALKTQNQALADSIATLQKLNTDTGNTATSTANAADSLNTATQQTLNATGTARQTLISGALPQLNSGLTALAGTGSALSAQLNNQSSLLQQSYVVLNQLDEASGTTRGALQDTDHGLSDLQTRLDKVTTDLTALQNAATLNGSSALGSIVGINGPLDVSKITDFMLSPTVLTTTTMFPVASYGSGMSPLFTNLSLWVGAFVLMVIIRLEVDDEDLDNPSVTERYWGRWLLLSILATAQALVTTVGELIIGVQTVNPFMFVLTAVISSLVYLSITYALSTTFLHVGKGLCVALIMIQIPGASGLYPIEMMPSFFRALYPFFPFTYSINAFRETIGGFYGNDWLLNIAKLLIFAVVFFSLGILARPHLVNLNRMFARQIEETDMIIGEPIQIPSREYRISEAISVLADKEKYRATIEEKMSQFSELYPKLRRGALIAGILVPFILAVTFSLTTGTKVIALATWMVWVLIIVAFLMTIEMARDSLARQVRLGTLSEEKLHGLLYEYEKPKIQRKRHTRTHPDKTANSLVKSKQQDGAQPHTAGEKEHKDAQPDGVDALAHALNIATNHDHNHDHNQGKHTS